MNDFNYVARSKTREMRPIKVIKCDMSCVHMNKEKTTPNTINKLTKGSA